MTPLQHACYKGNKEAVQLFLDLVSYLLSYIICNYNLNQIFLLGRRREYFKT
jgi:ankyrin repeat protein